MSELTLQATQELTGDKLWLSHQGHAPNLSSIEHRTLDDYTGSDHEPLNKHLRGEWEGEDYTLNGDSPGRLNEMSSHMDSAISKAPPTTQPIKVFRGVHGVDDFGTVGSKIGQTYIEHGYSSTSADQSQAHSFATNSMHGFHRRIPESPTLLHIHIPAGSNVLRANTESPEQYHERWLGEQDLDDDLGDVALKDEKEYILPRKSRFKVIDDQEHTEHDIHNNPYTIRHVHVQMMPKEEN